jgi:hypothetical protein
LSLPLFYIPYFSSQRVMVVRNLIVLLPFIAILAAHGTVSLASRLRMPLARRAHLAFIVIVFLLNSAWMVYAAQTIRIRRSTDHLASAQEMLERDPSAKNWISPRLQGEFTRRGVSLPSVAMGEATHLVFYFKEIPDHLFKIPANRPGLYQIPPTGPYEVNFDYYPTWPGQERPVRVAIDDARASGLLESLAPITH